MLTENILNIRKDLNLDDASPSITEVVLSRGNWLSIGEDKYYWSISKNNDWLLENPTCKWLASIYLICDGKNNMISIGAIQFISNT